MIPRFRAYFNDTKDVVEWEKLQTFKGLTTMFIDDEKYDSFTLMQATGLKDQEGTEFYEGDIAFDDHMESAGVVVFDDGAFLYRSENVSYYLSEVAKDVHIVGNIYENPNLLEGEK